MNQQQADVDRIKRVIYDEYFALRPAQRSHSQWIMAQDMHDWLRDLLTTSPDDPPDDDAPRTERSYLLGLPVEIREGIKGIRLEVLPPSGRWRCMQVSGGWWHERDCPHVDWSLAPKDPVEAALHVWPV